MSDCFLCAAPVPVNQEDACGAFLAGIASGAAHTISGDQLPPLCDAHRGDLSKLLDAVELRLVPHEDHFHIAGKDEEVSFNEKKE